MSTWKSLLQSNQSSPDEVLYPWTGEAILSLGDRYPKVGRDKPREYGWTTFRIEGRRAVWRGSPPTEAPDNFDLYEGVTKGYLVGNRLIEDNTDLTHADPAKVWEVSKPVFLVGDEDLPKFARIQCGRLPDQDKLIYIGPDMPLGPEDETLAVYEDRKELLPIMIKGVTPSLYLAFRVETWYRDKRDQEIAARRERERVERERLEREERVANLKTNLGSATGARAMAEHDFEEGAKAALRNGGAELLSVRRNQHENIVRFRYRQQRFECTCNNRLGIMDAGVCLTDESTGEKGDTWLSLETLPGVIGEAMDLGRLVIFRRVQ